MVNRKFQMNPVFTIYTKYEQRFFLKSNLYQFRIAYLRPEVFK